MIQCSQPANKSITGPCQRLARVWSAEKHGHTETVKLCDKHAETLRKQGFDVRVKA